MSFLALNNLQFPNEIKGKVKQDIFHQSATMKFPIGTKYEQDVRTFRYCRAGAAIDSSPARAAINAHIIPGDTGTDGFEGACGYNVAAGVSKVQIADTTATHTENYYAGGFLVVQHAALDRIPSYYIIGSTASNGTSLVLTLIDNLEKKLVSTENVTIYPSIYSKVQKAGSIQPDYEPFVVVPVLDVITSEYYFWGQTKGPLWVTPQGGTWPGVSACMRDVYFHTDGTIDPATIRVVGTLSPQRAGYLLSPSSTVGYGDAVIMLQLE